VRTRTLLASTLGTLLLAALTLPGIATAQPAARQPVVITAAKACGVVTLTFVNPETDVAKVHGFRWNAVRGDVATADAARTGLVTVAPRATVKETIRFDEDEFGGEAAVTVAVAFGPDSDIQPRLDVYPVDTDCTAPKRGDDCVVKVGVDAGEVGKLNLGLLCESLTPGTTEPPVPPTTTVTPPPPPSVTTSVAPPPAPSTTTTRPRAVDRSSDDDSGAYPVTAPETGGYTL
jgi:hypothetical protein